MFSKVVDDKSVVWISDFWQKPISSKLPSFGFIEIPFDLAVSHRPGTRFGSKSIIKNLNECTLYCTDKRTSIEKTIMTHFGSVDIVQSLETSYLNIINAVNSIPNTYIPICLGGDHSITAPIFKSIKTIHQNDSIGILVFDSHFDSRKAIPGRYHSGNWLNTLQEEGMLDNKYLVQVGIGANIYSEHYMDSAEKCGATIITVYDFRKTGLPKVVEKIYNKLNTNKLYISVDIDVIDQAFVPRTSVTNSNGLFPYEVCDAIFEIANNYEVIGFDITAEVPLF